MVRRTTRWVGGTVLFALVLAWCAAGAAEPGAEGPEVFRARREALLRALGGAGPVLVFGAEGTGAYTPFRQNNRFHYLTGVDEPGAILLLIPGRKEEVLFLDPGDENLERWNGPRLRPGPEAKERTGFRRIELRETLLDHLDRLLAGKPKAELRMTLAPEEIGPRIADSANGAIIARQRDPLDGGTWREDRIRRRLEERYKGLDVKDASPALRALREAKDDAEIAALREAGRISALGMIEAMRATRPDVREYEIEAAMAAVCRRLGGQGWAYAPIVGSGPNGLVLHYDRNDRQAKEGELVLMDAGFSWNYYVADITRTFPVSGRFTEEQKTVYQDLLDVQIEAIGRVRPGRSLQELNDWVNLKLRAKGYGSRIAHFLGHHVGMAVHDPGHTRAKLRPGNVITIEPGLYFEDRGFGIRIEDTVLVTADGCEVLTAGVPKDVAGMEALMKRE